MITSVWIVGDQLMATHPALADVERDEVVVVMIEAADLLPHNHRQKLVLLLSAMRHYAGALRENGYTVDYIQAESFLDGLQQHVSRHQPERLITMAVGSYDERQFQYSLPDLLGISVEVLPNTQFLTGKFNPIPNPEEGKRYVMERFYRKMRVHFDLLMDGDDPAGGKWNYDHDNRKKLPKTVHPPDDIRFEPDGITRAVMADVARVDPAVGSVDSFAYAVTREQAWEALEAFIIYRLPNFGAYEDALTHRSHSLFHSVLSPYLNIGLLEPLELAKRVEQAYRAGDVPLNSAEGFIRQIIGWREFMWWQYWRQMPGMKEKNSWGAIRPLPEFMWTGETDMRCVRHALTRVIETGYNHHIERLMVLSNFFMLTGINPREVNDWFMAMYIDAYEWVMPPNVIGMALNADGGVTATKPYIASANYINKMGDLCKGCAFDHKKRTGEGACPFNFLYWNFILTHEERLRANQRTSRSVLGLRHLDDSERENVRREAKLFLDVL